MLSLGGEEVRARVSANGEVGEVKADVAMTLLHAAR